MYCSLFKKTPVHNSIKPTKISWNKKLDALAIGGYEGFVKVQQIDFNKTKPDGTPVNPITMTQNLVHHKKKIVIIYWNEVYDKLTTCDEEGVIIVWKYTDKGQWDTEMINNRDASFVTDLKWNKQGTYLCFIYDDGYAIVGTVEGSRLWGQEIKDKLYIIEWSPDSSVILFGVKNSNVLVYSATGYLLGEIDIESSLRSVQLTSFIWWANPLLENNFSDHHLCFAYDNGTIMLYNDQNDNKPIKFKIDVNQVIKAEWNHSGTILAIAGSYIENTETRYSVFFYTNKGNLIKIFRLSNFMSSFCWDKMSTKLAITTESLVVFTLFKPKHNWTYFLNTLVYSFVKEADHHSVVFYDLQRNVKTVKFVKNFKDLTSFGSFSLISARAENSYLLILSNSIGSPIYNRIIYFSPEFIGLNDTQVIAASKHYIYVWQFRNSLSETSQSLNLEVKLTKEFAFFVDDNPNINDVYTETFSTNRTSTDPISALFVNESWLVISTNNGRVLRYTLPHISSAERMMFNVKFQKIGLSKGGNIFWGIDEENVLRLWDLEKFSVRDGKKCKGEKINFEKTDVWDVKWSSDDNASFCYFEKNKINVVRNLDVQEIIPSNGYLALYANLEIKVASLEEIMYKPEDHKLTCNEAVITFETRALRDLKEMMKAKVPIKEIYTVVERLNHQKTWTLLTQHSLLNLDFSIAEKSMIQYNDYIGLSFIKRLKAIDDDYLKKAEIYAFFLEYDKAEEIYNMMERRDLVISMRMKLGQWEKVIGLIKESGYVQEDILKVAYNNLAKLCVENKEYDRAEELYTLTNNHEGLINLWFKTENFEKAGKLIDIIPEGNNFLLFMGEKFETYGLCEEAVKCYLKFGDPKRAIDTCVLLNRWNLAVEFAEKNNFFQIEGLVTKFCNALIEKNRKMDLVELYRKSHRHTDAARMLVRIAEDLRALNASPLILKKIYVTAALEMESFKTRLLDAQITHITQQTVNTQTLDTLITSDLSNVSDKALNNPWKGAEAFHFYMLCQSQLYQGNYLAALKTSLRLVHYEKELDPKEVYRLISLNALLNKSYKECSIALSKLENLPKITKEEKEQYEELAIAIFTKYDPKNTEETKIKCPGKGCDSYISVFDIDCKVCGSNFSPCVVSGQSIFHKDYIKCKRCKHKAIKSEAIAKGCKYCSLCHSPIDLRSKQSN